MKTPSSPELECCLVFSFFFIFKSSSFVRFFFLKINIRNAMESFSYCKIYKSILSGYFLMFSTLACSTIVECKTISEMSSFLVSISNSIRFSSFYFQLHLYTFSQVFLPERDSFQSSSIDQYCDFRHHFTCFVRIWGYLKFFISTT